MGKYVDNKEFNAKITEYLILCEEKEQVGEEIPPVPHYIGESFLKIAEGLGSIYCFSKYTYLDEMKGDAVIACLSKIRNYNFRKYDNPFAYFTQICWFAFIGRINSEDDEKKIIYKMCENMSLEEFNLDSDDVDTKNQYLDFIRENFEQRELNKIRDSEQEKKFVHRMITKQKKVIAPEQQSSTQLMFD